MPLLLGVLCVLAIAYRYYSAFLAAKVAVLDDSRLTPAHRFNDGQNYHPTNKWVLFGHHFAAISGAGPLIGPVLAIQYGYMPGLLWLVIGVCLAGAVQDMLVLAASVRRGGKSLAEIARTELGPCGRSSSCRPRSCSSSSSPWPAWASSSSRRWAARRCAWPRACRSPCRPATRPQLIDEAPRTRTVYRFPAGCTHPLRRRRHADTSARSAFRSQTSPATSRSIAGRDGDGTSTLPAKRSQLVPGSSWGTFTIACTIPIALFVGLYMYRLRKGTIVEASLIGAVGDAGGRRSPATGFPARRWSGYFSLTQGRRPSWPCARYGFIASVLPVWLLLCPRDYLSSFLKIGTIALLVVGVFVANPALPCPPINHVFQNGGPTFPGGIFPVRLHLHHVRRDLRLPCPGVVGHDAEDDRQGKRTSGPSATARC